LGDRLTLSNEQLRLFIPLSRQIAIVIKNAETFEWMRDRDKLAAVGEMAAGLAHEIRNPLGAIKGAAELLKDPLAPENSHQADCLKIILDETERLTSILTDFLDYAKPRRGEPKTSCNPLQVVEHTVAMIQRDSKTAIEIESEKKDLSVEADPELLKQVLLNLLLNAVQASDTMEGRIWVRLKEFRPRRLLPLVGGLPLYKVWEAGQDVQPVYREPFVEISVADNGPGIPAEDLPRIFVPFYTTKPGGTGLGLPICRRIIENLGGTVQVKKNEPQGCCFTIHLPLKTVPSTEKFQFTNMRRPLTDSL